MKQIFFNVIKNAVEAMEPGGRLRIKARTDDDNVYLAFADTGAGIPPEHLPYVFERFYKGDAARAADSAGSGLGLSITKAIVERHGGTIRVTSQPGHTAFTIVLPQRQ